MSIRPRHIAQAFIYLLAIVFLAYFSVAPLYKPLDDNQAVIKLSLRHSGKILGECRQRTAEELAQLPPNMRIATVCPRARSPLFVELLLDGNIHFSEQLLPSGWQNDGMASLYKRFTVPATKMRVEIRMKDHIDSATFDYRLERQVRLNENQVLVIDFNASEKSFVML